MNKVYIYNDNFISLLTLIIVLIKKKIIPDDIRPSTYNKNLFDEVHVIRSEELPSTIDYIIKKIGYNNFNVIFKVYLSDKDNKEMMIYHYILSSLTYKDKTIYMKNDEYVLSCVKTSEYVSRENHKFKGFTRFKKMEDDIYYAEINPSNNILFLLSNHFKKRMKYDYWIIKDVNRNIYSVYNKENFVIVDQETFKIKDFKESEDEKKFSDLWCEFYKTIGIEARKNDRCRMNFMPKKYWKYILEVREEL